MLDPQIPLSVKPIQIDSPVQSVGQLMQMRGIMTQQLLHQAEISRVNAQTQEFQAVAQQRQRDLESNKRLQNVLMDPANHELLGKGDFSPIYKAGISPNIATPAIENLQKQAQTAQALQKGKAEAFTAGHAQLAQTIAGLDKDDTVAADQWNAAIPVLAQSHPEIASELTHLSSGPSFRTELQRIAAANGVARSIYENAAKLESEQAKTEETKSITAKNTAELPKIAAEAEKLQSEAELAALTTAGEAPIQPKDRETLDETARRNKALEDATKAARELSVKFHQESNATTQRGQNMVDARTRELNEINRDLKPPTSAETRALNFFMRAAGAEEMTGSMEKDMEKKGLFSQLWQNHAPNFLQSTDNQKYKQAQRAFSEARLRKDSGATIKDSEYDADAQTYFPQPGDTKQVLAQKKASRETILKGLHAEAGRAVKMLGDTPGVGGAPKTSGVIRARDPQGTLHEAPAGTPLPAGWKEE